MVAQAGVVLSFPRSTAHDVHEAFSHADEYENNMNFEY